MLVDGYPVVTLTDHSRLLMPPTVATCCTFCLSMIPVFDAALWYDSPSKVNFVAEIVEFRSLSPSTCMANPKMK
jgi:hypothetical protein